MSSSHPHRVPQGIPAGGQFAPSAHAEPSVALADRSTRPVALSPGEGDDFTELADGEVIERINIRRFDDGSGYWVSPAKTVDFHHLITPADLGTDDAGRDAWLEDNQLLIENFMVERYDAEMGQNDDDWSQVELEFNVPVHDLPLTEGAAADAAWNNSRIVQLHNESDHGTFGSENLGRLIRERVEASTSVANFYASRGAAMRMDDDDLDIEIANRRGKRELSDAAAMAVASRLGANRNSPAMLSLSINGHADTEQLRSELRSADPGKHITPQRRRRLDMLSSWIRNGGDNA